MLGHINIVFFLSLKFSFQYYRYLKFFYSFEDKDEDLVKHINNFSTFRFFAIRFLNF